MPLRLDDLSALDQPMDSAAGKPLLLPVDRVEEDPDQPRREFDANALEELAATIRERGIRQPVSVRPNLQRPDGWILNFGARRLRAARLAGLVDLPAFVDTTADSYDQVIENEQRLGLTPLELSLFVQKRLAGGETQAEIARRMGKSRQYVTLATALIEPPEWLLEAYRSGRCRGMAELYELRRLDGKCPAEIERWASKQNVITRNDVAQLKAMLAPELGATTEPSSAERSTVAAEFRQIVDGTPPSVAANREIVLPASLSRSSRRLHVEFEGNDYQLVVSVSPTTPGCFFVKPLNGGPRLVAKASALTLRGFVDP